VLIQGVLAKRVREAALGPALSELAWSIMNDHAAMRLASNECQAVLGLCNEAKTQKVLISYAMKLLIRILERNYKAALIESIVTNINSDKKIEILSSTGFLVSRLLNQGHQRDYLVHVDTSHYRTRHCASWSGYRGRSTARGYPLVQTRKSQLAA
jgi:hypothetical protein